MNPPLSLIHPALLPSARKRKADSTDTRDHPLPIKHSRNHMKPTVPHTLPLIEEQNNALFVSSSSSDSDSDKEPTKEPTVPCNPPFESVSFADKERFKEPTVPCNPPFESVSFAEQTKEPIVGNEFCKEEGPREPRFPSLKDETKKTEPSGVLLSHLHRICMASGNASLFLQQMYTELQSCMDHVHTLPMTPDMMFARAKLDQVVSACAHNLNRQYDQQMILCRIQDALGMNPIVYEQTRCKFA